VLAEATHREAHSHADTLPTLVERVLTDAGCTIEDLDGLAVSIGPGSFTGLRIGLAFAKGIAFAGRLPIAPVPTLEALAWVAGAAPGETICAALDARKREVYAAFFRVDPGGRLVRLTPDAALSPAALGTRLEKGMILVGDAAEVYTDVLGTRATVRSFVNHHPSGGVVARLGTAQLLAGHATRPEAGLGALEPVYVRPADAELPQPASR
jgi:tRNA threonylcarbamoyladenosine biosynthesis protein TsaB